MQIQFSFSLLILIILSQAEQSVSNLDKVNGILGFIHDVQEILPIVQADIEKLDTDEFNYTNTTESHIKVLQYFKNACIQVEQIEKHYKKLSTDTLYDYITASALDLYTIELLVEDTVVVSKHFREMAAIEKSQNFTSIILLAEAINWKISIQGTLFNNFYLELLGKLLPDKELLDELRARYEMPSNKLCHNLHSPQQLVYSLYKDIALTELKAYILTEYSFLIRQTSGHGNFSSEMNNVRLNYKNISEDALDTLITTMEKADRVLWRCDPEKHVHKVTYDEVTRLLQGYVENEVDLNNDESCSQTCPDYQNTTTMGCFDQKFCSQQQKCSGRIHNCQFVDSDLSVCQSPESSNRRYEYIQYSNGQRFGENETCWRDVNNVESWRRIFSKCSYCFCLCDDQGPKSDRFFNLRETLSDVRANKVVTGLRFVKKNRIFHLQIQQGKLLPRGAINESTVEWVPIDDYKIGDFNVTEGADYHSMSYKKRAIDLDEISSKDGKRTLVTGLRFRILRGRLNLLVMFSYFDFVKGEIFDPQFIIPHMSPDNEVRQKLNLDNLDIPTRSTESSQPLSKSNQYLEFFNSGVENDAAQTTIPFIDIQDVVSNPSVPLAGIGIYYKSSPGYGGFVAPKIISYDLSRHVRMPATLSKNETFSDN